jgi:hypothetical protein
MKVQSVSSEVPRQPEDRLITVSRLRDAHCPYLYFKNYVEDPRTHSDTVPLEVGLGGFFHDYIEKHLKTAVTVGGTVDKSHALDVEDLTRSFRMSFVWEGRLRAPYRIVTDKTGVEDYARALESVGRNFNDLLQRELAGRRVKGVEGDIQIQTDKAVIYGKYDLITEDADGTLTLWDWKTHMMPPARHFNEFRDHKIQLGIYAIWLKYAYKVSNVKAVAVFFGSKVEKITEVFSDAVERDVLVYLEGWRAKLNKLDRYPPVPNNLCAWCEWRPGCPAFEKGAAPRPAGLDAHFRPRAAVAAASSLGGAVAVPMEERRIHWKALGMGVGMATVIFFSMFWSILFR